MAELFLWIFLLILGLAILVKGADWFVDGSAGIAKKCKIPALIIGLTIVAFGTSAPELCVSVASAIGAHLSADGSTDIAIGNVLGSNIVNILLILGLAAIFHNLPVKRESLILDIPVLILASGLLIGLGIWGRALDWWDGLVFVSIMIAYTAFLIVKAKKSLCKQKTLEKCVPAGELPPAQEDAEQIGEEREKPKGKVGQWFAGMKQKTWFLSLLTVVGLGMVVGGGTLLVESAKEIADYFKISERIVALTVVAIGTSLPELVTSVVAARKGETDIAVGNVIGSNIFNILLVAGVSSLVYPLPFSLEGNLVDALVAFAAVLLLYFLALVSKKKQIGKVGGLVMLACFVGYYVYLFLGVAS